MVDTIEIPMDGGTAEAYVARPEAGGPEGPYPGVLFFIDAIGLRPRIAEMAAADRRLGLRRARAQRAVALRHRRGDLARRSTCSSPARETRSSKGR